MLQLKNITKDYKTGDTVVHALKGVSIDFRESEFVSVLGQSGCGKTTLLNIIGGLDRYTNGDLIINSVTTKKYNDRDWDDYRNHSIGFVFQSYNLIPHQTVLSNVELALTLSGVSKAERKKRAKEALEQVGLTDQINKKPNQLSGGQMQRVAITRALVNNPDILLADEPTGALDSETSVQIMDILKEVSKTKLVIMVTHNPELAQEYSTRIVKLLDGNIIDDSNPFEAPSAPQEQTEKKKKKRHRKNSMSIFTAMSLSLNNLLTKKARTLLTSFAGSIGIIGIALILSLSNGAQVFIDKIEEDTLSSYPLTVQSQSVDMTSFMQTMAESSEKTDHQKDKIYSNNIMGDMMGSVTNDIISNDLASFKEYIESDKCNINEYVNDIQYSYSTPLTIYKADTEDGVYQVNPATVYDEIGVSMGGVSVEGQSASSMMASNVWSELIGDEELINSQYDIVEGRLPKSYNEAVLIVDKNYEVTDYTLYALGLMDLDELREITKAMLSGATVDEKIPQQSYSFDEIVGLTFKLVPNTEYYEKDGDIWVDKSDDDEYMKKVIDEAEAVQIVGIITPDENSKAIQTQGIVGYTQELTEYMVNKVNESQIVKEQKENPDVDIFTGIRFDASEDDKITMDDFNAYLATLPQEQQTQISSSIDQAKMMGMTDEQILESFAKNVPAQTTNATYEGNMTLLGVADVDSPSMISIYPKDFDSKEEIINIIEDYNAQFDKSEGKQIQYTDFVGIMMSSVSVIVDTISYILMAFVGISLVVSSIMIGIITYISVLERTKEIGVLRSIGASKKDISRVFNAETLTIGFTAGAMGILVTLLLLIPINALIAMLSGITNIASLPLAGGIILIVISMLLTFIAGLIPARFAAKKDPVTALRTE